MLLADITEEPAPADIFKTEFIKKEQKLEIVDKINTINHFMPNGDYAEQDGPGNKATHQYRWSTIENQFNRKKKRIFDELPPAILSK